MPSYEDEQIQNQLKEQRDKFAKRRADAGMVPVPNIDPRYTQEQAAKAFEQAAAEDMQAEAISEHETELQTADELETETLRMFGGMLAQSEQVKDFIARDLPRHSTNEAWQQLLIDGKAQAHYDGLLTELSGLVGERRTPERMSRRNAIQKELAAIEKDSNPGAGEAIGIYPKSLSVEVPRE
jgi:hypothetical protein